MQPDCQRVAAQHLQATGQFSQALKQVDVDLLAVAVAKKTKLGKEYLADVFEALASAIETRYPTPWVNRWYETKIETGSFIVTGTFRIDLMDRSSDLLALTLDCRGPGALSAWFNSARAKWGTPALPLTSAEDVARTIHARILQQT